MKKPINLFDLIEWSNIDDSLGLIIKPQLFGILLNEQKRIRGLPMKLVKDQSSIDRYKWIFIEKYTGTNKKGKKSCNCR
jgi:hypothetical protein